jgi:hypothetical protein
MLRDDLRLYIRQAWHVVEPSTIYLENWHIDLIAEYLEAVTAGQIKRLLINMPPRYAKSTCVSIMWPTWVWAREGFPGRPHNPVLEGPGTRWIFASYADELRTKHSLDRRKMRWIRPVISRCWKVAGVGVCGVACVDGSSAATAARRLST